MTNFEKLKNTPLGLILPNLGFEELDIQINAFMNMFQCINCRYCPVIEQCGNGEVCEHSLKKWLEQEATENE